MRTLFVVLSIAFVGVAAREALSAEPAPVAQLIKSLSDPKPEVRAQAARSLGAAGAAAKGAGQALVARLTDDNAQVRTYAAHALGQIRATDPTVVPALAKLVADRDAGVRRAALGALRAIHPGPKVAIPLVAKALEDADPSVIMPALSSMAEAGDESLPALIEALGNERAKYWACLVAGEMGPKAKAAVPALVKLLDDPLPEVRMQAVLALGEIGPDAGSASKQIAAKLEDEQKGVRYGAAFALGTLGAADATSALQKAAADSDPFMHMIAIWALAKLNPRDDALQRKSVAQLIEALKGSDKFVRRGAARALFELKAPPELTAPALLAAMEDPDYTVRGNVYQGLASLGPRAVPRIVERLTDDKSRPHAVRILSLMGPAAKEAVAALSAQLPKVEPAAQDEILYALGAIGPESAAAVPAILALLKSADDDVRTTATYTLAKIGPAAKAAAPELKQQLASKNKFLATMSAWALLKVQPNDAETVRLAVPMLAKAVTESDSELGRAEAAATLGELGAAAKSAVPALKKAADDVSPAVREAAADALKKIGA